MNNIKLSLILMVTILIPCLLCFRVSNAQQQNAQWSFYLAFEDATGARDTIWALLDTASTISEGNISGLFGEVPIQPDSMNFQVWFYHPNDNNGGSNPTHYYNTFLEMLSSDVIFGPEIIAANYQLPITVTWDTTLFMADILYENGGFPVNYAKIDNQYLFMTYQEGNWDPENGWDMTIIDHVELPTFWWGSQTHFPLTIRIKRGPLGTGVGVDKIKEANFSISPNPAVRYIDLNLTRMETGIIRIYAINGKLVKHESFSANQKRVNLNGLKPGLYFVAVESAEGTSVRKLIVSR